MSNIKVEEYRIKRSRSGGQWTVTIVSNQGGVTVKTQSTGRTYDEAVALARSKEMDRRKSVYQLQFPNFTDDQLQEMAMSKPAKKASNNK